MMQELLGRDTYIRAIARIAHEVNRAYCESLGDFTQVTWNDAPDWQRESAFNGVAAIVEGRVTTPEQSHMNWMREKIESGWTYGATKNPVLKQHPCMVPYDELPHEQRVKDSLFFAVVRAAM